ncbi:MAG TPA: YncE family protein [Candidatus Dormibacteraeota bacterium]|nr:YncE family protein [Candidatus Dormibacteraeota bacterium]
MRTLSKNLFWLMVLLVSAAFVFAGTARAAGPGRAPAMQRKTGSGYHLIRTYKIGGDTFWDYMGIDVERRHLFIAHHTHVVVMNADTGKVVHVFRDTPGVHGVAVAPELNRGFISDGATNSVTIFNLATLKVIGTVKVTGHNPDCIIYDPASGRVFTFNGDSDNSTAIDARTGKVVGTIDLGGRPEYAVADGRGHVYNNLVDKSEEVAIDSHTLKITKRWPLAPCEHPSGIAMDTAHRWLFVGCHNQMMAIVNPDTAKVAQTVPIGPGIDACRFDPGTELAFCSSGGGGGTLTVVKEDPPGRFSLVGHVKTEPGARTMEVDRKTHNVFLDTATQGPRPAKATPQNPYRQGKIVPGSFRVLELAP